MGENMNYPDNPIDFIKQYSFSDKQRVYTIDKYREKYPVIQEFEKPEYCPLKRQERSDNHDGE